MKLPPVLFHGSVKTVRGIEKVKPYVFEFTDNYSVFDWGVMPDPLENKGKSLAFMSNLFFHLLSNKNEWKSWPLPTPAKKRYETSKTYQTLQENGLSHHGMGLVNENMANLSLKETSPYLAVHPVNIIKPDFKQGKWDYSSYQSRPTNALVPLEVVFRFSIPKGSSLLERAGNKEYCHDLGLMQTPKEGDQFDLPIIEYSSKLESSDRYMNYQEAREISGLSESEFKTLTETSTLIALRLKDYFQEINIDLHDGKFEFAFSEQKEGADRKFMLVDVITPDELRLAYKTIPLSKENLRNYYRKSSWFENVKKAKIMAQERGEKDWKGICVNELKSTPSNLDPQIKKTFSMIYQTLANALAQKHLDQTLFSEVWTLDELIAKM